MSSPDNPQFEPAPLEKEESQQPASSAPDSTIGAGGANVPSPMPPPSSSPGFAPVSSGPRPVENPAWSGWDVLLIFGLTIVTMAALQIATGLEAQFLWYRNAGLYNVLQRMGQEPFVLIVWQFLIYIPAALFMIALVEGKYHVPFWRAIRWNWPRSEWRLLAMGVATVFALNLLANLFPTPKDTPFEHLFDRPRDAYLMSIIAVSIGPLMEELFFRGLMYPVLARRLGVTWGVLLTALPFGLIHLPQYGWAWGAALVVFLVGVVCGLVRAVTKSVGASFLVHVGYNGTQMLIAVVTTQGFRHMEKALFCTG